MPVRKNTLDKTHKFFQWHMFEMYVAPQPHGTVHYLPLLLLIVTSFLRNNYGGRGTDRRPRPTLKNRKKVQIPPSSSWHTTNSYVPQVYRGGEYFAAVVDWSVRAAPLLLYCRGGRLVGGVVGAWWVLDG